MLEEWKASNVEIPESLLKVSLLMQSVSQIVLFGFRNILECDFTPPNFQFCASAVPVPHIFYGVFHFLNFFSDFNFLYLLCLLTILSHSANALASL